MAAFQPSHGGLARSHLFGNLLLTQACVDAGFDQFAGKLKFWFEGCAFLEKLRIFIPLFPEGCVRNGHDGSSLSRVSAI